MNNKETIKSNFEAGDVPTEQDFADLIDGQVGVLDDLLQLPAASSANLGVCYVIGGTTMYRCELSGGNYTWVARPFSQAAATDYLNLTNKPSINGHVLGKNNSLADLGIDTSGFQQITDKIGGSLAKDNNGVNGVLSVNDQIVEFFGIFFGLSIETYNKKAEAAGEPQISTINPYAALIDSDYIIAQLASRGYVTNSITYGALSLQSGLDGTSIIVNLPYSQTYILLIGSVYTHWDIEISTDEENWTSAGDSMTLYKNYLSTTITGLNQNTKYFVRITSNEPQLETLYGVVERSGNVTTSSGQIEVVV